MGNPEEDRVPPLLILLGGSHAARAHHVPPHLSFRIPPAWVRRSTLNTRIDDYHDHPQTSVDASLPVMHSRDRVVAPSRHRRIAQVSDRPLDTRHHLPPLSIGRLHIPMSSSSRLASPCLAVWPYLQAFPRQNHSFSTTGRASPDEPAHRDEESRRGQCPSCDNIG
jgi:hypothetical protein